MKYTILFLLLGSSLVYLAFSPGYPAWLLVWTGLSFAAVGTAYGGLGPGIFGKRATGAMAWWSLCLLLPYLLLTWLLWYLQRLFTREPCCNQVAPGVWLGRRPFARELPPNVTMVVDLTAEFLEPRNVMAGRSYVCLPTLDTMAPRQQDFQKAMQLIAASEGDVYIHCAMGHGRSAMAAAAVLLARRLAESVEQAEELVKKARPGIKLNPAQRVFLRQLESISPGCSRS